MCSIYTVDIFTDIRRHTKDLPCRKEDGLEICKYKIHNTTVYFCFTRSFALANAEKCGIDGLKPSDFDLPCLV